MPKTTVKEASEYSIAAHEFIWSQLSHTAFPADARSSLVLAYVAIVLEHQHAIVNLVNLNLRGSALALFRPQVETAFRGLWVNLIASDDDVKAISQKGAEPFPKFRAMAEELDKQYGSGGWLLHFADEWKTLNGLTHSGLEQLSARFRADGNLAPSYEEHSIAALLTSSATLSIGTLVPIYKQLGLADKATELEKWLGKNKD